MGHGVIQCIWIDTVN